MLRIIDTETCGLQGGIVEIASVDVVDGKIVNPMSHLVRPDRPISPQAMAIHRIPEDMRSGASLLARLMETIVDRTAEVLEQAVNRIDILSTHVFGERAIS